MIKACRSWATREMASRSSSSMATSRMFSGGSESVIRYAFASEEKVIFGMAKGDRARRLRAFTGTGDENRGVGGIADVDYAHLVGQLGEDIRARPAGHEIAHRAGHGRGLCEGALRIENDRLSLATAALAMDED